MSRLSNKTVAYYIKKIESIIDADIDEEDEIIKW